MKFKKLYSAVYGGVYPFGGLAEEHITVNKPEEMTDDDGVLVIWGGADINPDFYNHPHSKTTHPSDYRDPKEWALVQDAIKRGITIIGVCRGAQMLCAAAGGFLIQDVRGHLGNHTVMTSDGLQFKTNSIHHQMMAGYEKVPHELLAWMPNPLAEKYVYKDDQAYIPPENFVEAEYIYFPAIRGHAIQWHPEGLGIDSEANRYVINAVKERMVPVC